MAESRMAGPLHSTIRSMTGFARVRRPMGDGEIVVTIKSLNHRGLDIHFHAGPEMDALEADLRSLIKQKLSRGHVELRIGFQRGGTGHALALNRPLLEAWLAAFRIAAAQHGLAGEPDLNMALGLPGMFGPAGEQDPGPEFGAAVTGILEEALDALNCFREREGAELAAALRLHNAQVHQSALEMEDIRSRALPAFHARLSERLGDLLHSAAVDPQRLAQEVAVIADRSDIGEEVARLKIHTGQLDALLDSGGEIGKKLDFLLQEMNRETNTILSKTSGIGELGLKITDLALAAKADIEKIREQALNLE
ncbi:MAG TPA: YicC/YloC family endoribonuclease [Bryobacteraceae bacterium]|nr:YicC/YloC family endoribonuclease [Bryobacteraceae bacterium]